MSVSKTMAKRPRTMGKDQTGSLPISSLAGDEELSDAFCPIICGGAFAAAASDDTPRLGAAAVVAAGDGSTNGVVLTDSVADGVGCVVAPAMVGGVAVPAPEAAGAPLRRLPRRSVVEPLARS